MASHDHELGMSSQTHGLISGCPRCEELSKDPEYLDETNLKRIWSGFHKSPLDLTAYNILYRSTVLSQKLGHAFKLPDHGLFKFGGKV